MMYRFFVYIGISSLCIAITTRADNSWAHTKLQQLSLDEKIGQLFMVAAVSDEDMNASFMKTQLYTMHKEHVEKLIQNYHVGGVIFLGIGTPEKQMERTKHYQTLSTNIPLLIGQDFEWGLSMRLHNTVRFPRNMTLGALANNDLIYKMGAEIARQAHLLGVHMIFAPVVDVNSNPANPVINDRSFGSDKEKVTQKGIAFMRGLQDHGIIACAKHFPGHGDTIVDSHEELPLITKNYQQLEATELYPFKKLIESGVRAVMMAQLNIPTLNNTAQKNVAASLSHNVVTNLLKKKCGFQGLTVTDGLGMGAIMHNYQLGDLEVQAVQAGNDILLCSVDVAKAHAALKQAVLNNIITEKELDERVLSVLRAKQWAFTQQIMPCDAYNEADLHTPYAYALKQKLYQQAITMVKDDNQLIPLSSHSKNIAAVQIGGSFDNAFMQILQHHLPSSLCARLSANAPEHDFFTVCNHLDRYDTIIVGIFGMNKFIHHNFGISAATQQYIARLQESGKKIILVLFGSPYSIELFKKAPTILLAYEDDEDAQKAAAHTLLGNFQAQGSLPI